MSEKTKVVGGIGYPSRFTARRGAIYHGQDAIIERRDNPEDASEPPNFIWRKVDVKVFPFPTNDNNPDNAA